MKKAGTFLLSSLAHIGYFAILLQAFIVVPPTAYFGPCACTIIGPKLVKRLVVMNLFQGSESRSAHVSNLASGSGHEFCPDTQRANAAIYLNNLGLEASLEKLVFSLEEPVNLCVTINETGDVVSAQADSSSLSSTDERLIADYITDKWSFAGAPAEPTLGIGGTYALTLGAREELQ